MDGPPPADPSILDDGASAAVVQEVANQAPIPPHSTGNSFSNQSNITSQQPQPHQVPLPQSTYGPPSGPTTPNELPPGARRPTLAGNGPPPVAQPPPQARPQTQNAPVRHSRGQSLVDQGFIPPPPDSRQSPSNRYRNQSPQSRPSGGPHRPAHSNSVIPIPASTKGPATFQEMGFQSQKMEEKECRVM